MSDGEYEKFEVTDYDLENEFNPNRGRRRPTKNQQIYGKYNTTGSKSEINLLPVLKSIFHKQHFLTYCQFINT